MIRKPLQQFEKGLWGCEIHLADGTSTATYFAVESSTPAEYLKRFKENTKLDDGFTISCNVPYYSAWCQILAPNKTVYLSKTPNEISLGRCSITVEQSTNTDNGAWTCLFAEKTGQPDDQISIENINHDIEYTFKECYDWCFNPNLIYDATLLLFKIDAVCGFLQDELNTGHWSEVPSNVRQAFTSASYVKALTILKRPDNSVNILQDALRCIDFGLLLGAPLNENQDLLTRSAAILSKELSSSYPENDTIKNVNKRKDVSDYADKYDSLPGEEICTLECPSVEAFNNKHFIPQCPVKLQDCITHWPASEKWLDINYLLKIAGDRTVPVEIGSRYTDEDWTQKLMSLKDFIQTFYLRNTEGTGYLAQHNLFDQISELKNDICIPEYCGLSRDYENSTEPDVNAWFGPKGTVSPLHYDPKDNLLAQVYGAKQILLFPPKDSEYLYPQEDKLLFNTSQVDPINPDLEKYSKYCKVNPYKCLLEGGEMLYIPPKWWHHVSALDNSFSVSFWWQ